MVDKLSLLSNTVWFVCMSVPFIVFMCTCFPFQSKTYDSITDKFLDFSFEKTNSAYMLFYERCVQNSEQGGSKVSQRTPTGTPDITVNG